MLAITGASTVWFISDIRDMRKGRHSLLESVRDTFPDPYNGDIFVFMSKARRLLKMVKYEDHMYVLYEVEYDRGYKFMEPVYEDGNLVRYQLDFKYLVGLLKCPVVIKLRVYSD